MLCYVVLRFLVVTKKGAVEDFLSVVIWIRVSIIIQKLNSRRKRWRCSRWTSNGCTWSRTPTRRTWTWHPSSRRQSRTLPSTQEYHYVISHKNLQIRALRDILCNHAEPQHLLSFIREGWNLAFIFNASLSQDTVVCRSGLTCVVQEVLQVLFEL